MNLLTLRFCSVPIRHPASSGRPSFFRSPPPLVRRGGVTILPMATSTSPVRPPLAEDNNLALGGSETRLTGCDRTRMVLPNLSYPLQSTRYGHSRAAQPTSSSLVDASPPTGPSEQVGSLRFAYTLVNSPESVLTPLSMLSSVLEALVAALAHVYRPEIPRPC